MAHCPVDINSIKIYHQIYKGNNSKVYKGSYKGKTVLYKTLKIKDETKTSVMNEINLVLKLGKHPNIIHVMNVVEFQNSYFIMMDDFGKYNLWSHPNFTNFDTNTRCNISRRIIEGLEYLHNNLIAHLDIKSKNIVLDNQLNPKICDFGFSIKTESTKIQCQLSRGTPMYVAPEVVISQYGNPFQADIYSLGILLWEIFAKEEPYFGTVCKTDEDIENFLREICFFGKRPNINKIPKILSNILILMWTSNPADRPSIKKAKVLLELIEIDLLTQDNI